MTFKELCEALGLDEEKVKILKAEYTTLEKQVNDSKKKIDKLEKEQASLNESKDKLDIVVKACKLDMKADDFDKMLDDVKDSFAGNVKGSEDYKELNRELTKARREFDSLKKENEKIVGELATEKANRVKSVKQSAILKELQANNVIKAEQWVNRFFAEAELDEDGVNIFMKDEAGKEIPLKDGIADWAKANPEFVKVDARGGAGSGAGGGSNNKENEDFMNSIIGDGGDEGGQKSLAELFG